MPGGAVPLISVYYAACTGPLLPIAVRETDTTQQCVSDKSYKRHFFELKKLDDTGTLGLCSEGVKVFSIHQKSPDQLWGSFCLTFNG
jgi:hypothetical protein